MSTSKRNPRPRQRATTQTIEQIEARAAEIEQAERDVMLDLAEWLRARGRRAAAGVQAAAQVREGRDADRRVRRRRQHVGVNVLVKEHERDTLEALIAQAQRALERF